MKSTNQKGFTLIEIAIVLVIIGLLLGGVLKGQALIGNAKIRGLTNEANGYVAAWQTYIDRYSQIPGDDSQATTRFPAAVVAALGIADGNGGGTLNTAAERFIAFSDMAAANLTKSFQGIGTQYPTHKFGGQIQILANTGGFQTAICYTALILSTAEALDLAIDGTADGTIGSVKRNNSTAYVATNNTVCIEM